MVLLARDGDSCSQEQMGISTVWLELRLHNGACAQMIRRPSLKDLLAMWNIACDDGISLQTGGQLQRRNGLLLKRGSLHCYRTKL